MSCRNRFGRSIGYCVATAIVLALSGCVAGNVEGTSLLAAGGGPCTDCDLAVSNGRICPPHGGWANGYTTWRPLQLQCAVSECVVVEDEAVEFDAVLEQPQPIQPTEDLPESQDVDEVVEFDVVPEQPQPIQPTEDPPESPDADAEDGIDPAQHDVEAGTSGLVQPAIFVFSVPERVRIIGGRGGWRPVERGR